MAKLQHHKDDPLVCLCNRVPRSALLRAMDGGADSMAALFDQTFAGCGPCGGSCQPDVARLLQAYRDGELHGLARQPPVQRPRAALDLDGNMLASRRGGRP